MTHRRAQFLVLWLLPFLVMRALVPVGFMAHVDHGQFNVVICSDGFAKVTKVAAHVLLGAAPQDDNQHKDSDDHAGVCPFAQSGSAAPPITNALICCIPFVVKPISFHQQPSWVVRLAGSHRARGPPVFS